MILREVLEFELISRDLRVSRSREKEGGVDKYRRDRFLAERER